MREVPYETDHDVRARSRRDEMYERINDFLARKLWKYFNELK